MVIKILHSSHFSHVSWLTAHGFEVVMFDYPGYGESTGMPTRTSTVQTTVEIVERFAGNATDQMPTFLFGQSLGANIAAVVAATNTLPGQVKGLQLPTRARSIH